MAWAAIGQMVVEGANKVMGGLQQSAYLRYQAKAAKAEGEQAALDAAEEAARTRDRVRRALGTGRVITAASGIETGEGSAIDAAADVVGQGELEALTSIWQGDIARRRAKAQAGLLKQQATNALIGGFVGAGGSVLGGLDRWQQRQEFAKRFPTPSTGGTGGAGAATSSLYPGTG